MCVCVCVCVCINIELCGRPDHSPSGLVTDLTPASTALQHMIACNVTPERGPQSPGSFRGDGSFTWDGSLRTRSAVFIALCELFHSLSSQC